MDLVVVGVVALIVGLKLHVAPDDATPTAVFQRAMRIGCIGLGAGAPLLGLRDIITG